METEREPVNNSQSLAALVTIAPLSCLTDKSMQLVEEKFINKSYTLMAVLCLGTKASQY